MARRVFLDAMITREDFMVESEAIDVEQKSSASLMEIGSDAPFGSLFRKPDFQRETNYWTPEQVVKFIESYVDNELVPSAILWRSSSFVFVIDGGHRISALRAWMTDDFGTGVGSFRYYNGEFSDEQRKVADTTRKLVESRVGKYADLLKILAEREGQDPKKLTRAVNLASRGLTFQWVKGDAEKAESSFFNINTQGTALDAIEETLLRNRKRTAAIAARSIVRAATGHQYWSSFDPEIVRRIREDSKALHQLIFEPEIPEKIRGTEFPIGGKKANIAALEILLEMFQLIGPNREKQPCKVSDFVEDADGNETLRLFKRTLTVINRIYGTRPESLGLYPGVYFYSQNGRHIPDLFLGIVQLFVKKLDDNDQNFFQRFTRNREKIEENLITHKGLILTALQSVISKNRVDRATALFEVLANSDELLSEDKIVSAVNSKTSYTLLSIKGRQSAGAGFSEDTKATIAIRTALEHAPKCSICGGYLDVKGAATFDHIVRRADGGHDHQENGVPVHPYCNSAIKN